MTDADETKERARVTIHLDRDLALAFFEWSYQFMTDHNPTFRHPADAIAVDQISTELERTLTEPFLPEYATLLRAARARALAAYRHRIGDEHSQWLDNLDYQEPAVDKAQRTKGTADAARDSGR
ncbi:MAG: hypothetical protein AAGM22_16855 [Acidobacteriota bacterium]